ncbi:anhydro-N-acetylmuramic acid kinase [Gymnodinialimonas ulvae]|uniref:anhydro-N-acetylmuramic acid kinase n=1 Tax=Gymnodinialimonas ulvae TaxID=3126504 RepID=UPI0030AC145E
MAGKEKGRGHGHATAAAGRVAGAMSGTSFDGVDVAVIETDGVDIMAFGEVGETAYSEADRAVLRAAMGAWPGEARAQAAAEVVEAAHIAALADISDVSLLGFHGQTLAHDPEGGRTHQVGDGQVLADALGVEVISDFRSADVGLGGQGAPLAPFYHWACARWIGADAPVVFLNLGGVANISCVDPRTGAPEDPGACLAFDTGPANAPVDDLMATRGLGRFDKDGALAGQGQIDMQILERMLSDAWFETAPPKSLDRDAFAALSDAVSDLSDADAAATLTACSAGAVGRALPHLPNKPAILYATGGGRRNATLMAMLADATAADVVPVEAVGLDGDALEAQAFAYLARRVDLGLPTSAPGTTGVAAPVGGGHRARPNRKRQG